MDTNQTFVMTQEQIESMGQAMAKPFLEKISKLESKIEEMKAQEKPVETVVTEKTVEMVPLYKLIKSNDKFGDMVYEYHPKKWKNKNGDIVEAGYAPKLGINKVIQMYEAIQNGVSSKLIIKEFDTTTKHKEAAKSNGRIAATDDDIVKVPNRVRD